VIGHTTDRSPLYAAAVASLTGLAGPAGDVAARVGTSLVAGLITWAVTQAASWLKNKLFPKKGQGP